MVRKIIVGVLVMVLAKIELATPLGFLGTIAGYMLGAQRAEQHAAASKK